MSGYSQPKPVKAVSPGILFYLLVSRIEQVGINFQIMVGRERLELPNSNENAFTARRRCRLAIYPLKKQGFHALLLDFDRIRYFRLKARQVKRFSLIAVNMINDC